MNKFLCGLLAWLSLLITAEPAFAIVGGERVPDGRFSSEFPWLVALVKKDSGQVCGGALIAPRWVLTAAHCTNMDRYVLYGHASRYSTDRVEIERAIRHPQFSAETFRYDIGLLKLAEPLTTATIAVPDTDQANRLLVRDGMVTIAGWGKTDTGRQAASRLNAAELMLRELLKDNVEFAFIDRGGPCSGDSGAPLIMSDNEGQRLLIGIASRTDGNLCSKNGGLAIYTRVDAVREFIGRYVTAPAETGNLEP